MHEIKDAILADSTSSAVAGLAVPESYRGVVVRADEQDMFEGLPTREKDPRKSLHVEEVATPELGPGEAIVAVMASSVNYNTVWTSIFEPVSTFGFLQRYGQALRADQQPRPALPRRRLRPGRRRAARPAPG